MIPYTLATQSMKAPGQVSYEPSQSVLTGMQAAGGSGTIRDILATRATMYSVTDVGRIQAVLQNLIQSGLVTMQGSGPGAIYQITSKGSASLAQWNKSSGPAALKRSPLSAQDMANLLRMHGFQIIAFGPGAFLVELSNHKVTAQEIQAVLVDEELGVDYTLRDDPDGQVLTVKSAGDLPPESQELPYFLIKAQPADSQFLNGLEEVWGSLQGIVEGNRMEALIRATGGADAATLRKHQIALKNAYDELSAMWQRLGGR